MKIQDENPREHQSAVTPKVQQEPGTGGTATIADHRPSTIRQRELREAMHNSPRVTQLREKQAMMNSSPRVQQHATLRATMNAHAASKALPVQRKAPKGSFRFQQLATAMGAQHGVDTSGLVATHNSSFPWKLNAEATIQGNNIHFAPGMDTDHNIRHEVAHAIDNTLNGTPKGNQIINGHPIDTTRENAADRMAKVPLTQRNVKVNATEDTRHYKSGHQETSVIQRAVGFEFECSGNVKTYKKGFKGYKPLKKKDPIIRGRDFHVEADGLPGGDTSLEFVTVPFPETRRGLDRLIAVCRTITGMCRKILQTPSGQYAPATNLLGENEVAERNRYFKKEQVYVTVKPQVTAGFSLDALDKLYDAASATPVPGIPNFARDSVNPGIANGTPGYLVDNVLGNMRTAADNAIRNAGLDNIGPVSELRGLVTHLIMVIVGGTQNIQATPKTVMRLALGRSDMATAFNALPQQIVDHFRQHPGAFENLVMNAASAVQGGGSDECECACDKREFIHSCDV